MTTPVSSSYRGVRVMVLGAGGFIGRWVARLLTAQGADLLLVGRDAGWVEAVRRGWAVNGSVMSADLAAAAAVTDLIRIARPAIIFNLAGYGVDPSERDPASAERLNAELPPGLAESMAEWGARGWPGQQIVHAGSALEYGTASGDLRETTEGAPTTLYGRTKLDGTRRLHQTAERIDVRAVTGRLFMVYGPGEHDGRLLPTLLGAAHSTTPIPLTAGTQQRDFTYVEDAAAGLLRLGALAGPALGAVNVATGRLTAVRGFVEAAAAALGIAPGRLEFGAVATRVEEMQHDPINIDRLRGLTGWAPAATIREGVASTVAFGRDAPPGF